MKPPSGPQEQLSCLILLETAGQKNRYATKRDKTFYHAGTHTDPPGRTRIQLVRATRT